MKKGLALRTADAIRSCMKTHTDYTPSSIAHVKSKYGVSGTTACAAVRVLVNEGLLTSTRGKGIKRSGGLNESPSDELVRELQACIQEGIWQNGECLPKFDHLVRQYQVSRNTVSGAMDRLSRALLIHKKGMAWVVGPRPPSLGHPDLRNPASLESMALLLCSTSADNPASNLWLLPFMEPMITFLREKGIEGRYAHRTNDPLINKAFLVLQEAEIINKTIRDYGELYRGAIILDRFMDSEFLRKWFGVLSAAGTRPVVLFDSAGDRKKMTRGELNLGSHYYLLHLDEEGAVDLALQSLLSAGHQTIGLPISPWLDAPWARHRLALIRRRAARLAPGVAIVPGRLTEPFFAKGFELPTGAYLSHDFSQLMETWTSDENQAQALPRRAVGKILRDSGSLAALIAKGATAFLCINDNLATLCYFWCCAAGFRIPEDISIISFDNHREYQRMPLATVDFGFSRLGYLAGHIIRGAIPSEAGRSGTIPGICTLVNRGSLGNIKIGQPFPGDKPNHE